MDRRGARLAYLFFGNELLELSNRVVGAAPRSYSTFTVRPVHAFQPGVSGFGMYCFFAPLHRFTAIIGEIDEELDSQIEQMKTISAGFPKTFILRKITVV